jgi:hypothetical protein
MKARVKATGEIKEVARGIYSPYQYVDNEGTIYTENDVEELPGDDGVEEEDKTVKTEVFGDTIFYPADAGERLEIIRNNNYQFVDENGNVINATKIVLEKKKKEYPKTYEECSKIDPMTWGGADFKYYNTLLSSFYKLLICRNAYWKIAGREMGLGISWKPSWDKCTGEKYCISRVLNAIRHDAVSNSEYHNRILAFPTEEMRDAFYENFKELIEQCKELL